MGGCLLWLSGLAWDEAGGLVINPLPLPQREGGGTVLLCCLLNVP